MACSLRMRFYGYPKINKYEKVFDFTHGNAGEFGRLVTIKLSENTLIGPYGCLSRCYRSRSLPLVGG